MSKPIYIAFTLSMPGSPSWNGKWSGEGKLYAIVKKFTGARGADKAKSILANCYYSYSWSDGWRAGIDAKMVDGKTAGQFRKRSCGFCGYDWMVDSILVDGVIKSASDKEEVTRIGAATELTA